MLRPSAPYRKKWVRNPLLVLFSVFVVGTTTILASGSAQAHYVYTWGNVYESDAQCVEAWDEISHGSRTFGYLKAQTYSTKATVKFIDCALDKSVLPGYIRTHPQLWQDGGSAADKKCNDWGWWQNTYSTAKLLFTRDFEGMPTGGGCAGKTGWYGTYAAHGVKYNGVWYGDSEWVFSGWHCLPSTATCSGNGGPPHVGQKMQGLEGGMQSNSLVKDMPFWVDANTHVVDYDRMPAAMRAEMPLGGTPVMAPGAQGVGGDGQDLDGVVIYEGSEYQHAWTPDGSPALAAPMHAH